MARGQRRCHNILITGATDGIGLLIAKAYASRGHNVLATGKRSIANDRAFFSFPNITYISADQADPEHAAQTILKALEDMEWEALDVAILNGATAWSGLPHEESMGAMRRQIDINFTAATQISLALAPLLFAARGKLVLIGSTAFRKSRGSFATYVATKAALDGFCRSLREEWRDRASVLIIHPGPTRTGLHQKAGMKLGIARLFFMSPKRAARAIQTSVREDQGQRMITRVYGWLSLLSRTGKERL